MATLNEKLTDINNSKQAIKQALINKGRNPSDVLSSYAQEIENVYTGVDTSDATASSSDILQGMTAYARGKKLEGTIVKIEGYKEEAVSSIYSSDTGVIVRNSKNYPICLLPNAGMTVDNESTASAIRLTADIIKKGETVLGMTGTLEIGVDTTDSDATADDLAIRKTAYVKGVKIVGTIPEISEGTTTSASTIANENGIKITADEKVILDRGAGITVDIDTATSSLEVTADKILYGKAILGVQGTATQTSNQQSPATSSDILTGKVAFVNGKQVTGNVSTTINSVTSADKITLSSGYVSVAPFTRRTFVEDTAKTISISNSALAQAISLTPNLIKKDETVLGITGTYVGEAGTGTEDATAEAVDIVQGKTAYVNKVKVTGTLPTLINSSYTSKTGSIEKVTSSVSGDKYRVTISELATKYTDGIMLKGSNIVLNLTPSQLATAIGLTPEMIAEGTTILGITGNYTGTGKLTEEEYNEIEALADSVLAKAN